MSVVYAAGLVLAVTLAVLAVDWRKIERRLRRPTAYVNAMVDPERHADLPGPIDITHPAATIGEFVKVVEHGDVVVLDWPTVYRGEGFRVLAESTVDVKTREYANGTTQIWLKRKAA